MTLASETNEAMIYEILVANGRSDKNKVQEIFRIALIYHSTCTFSCYRWIKGFCLPCFKFVSYAIAMIALLWVTIHFVERPKPMQAQNGYNLAI